MYTSDWLQNKKDRIEKLTKDFSVSKYNLLKISYLEKLLDESFIRVNECEICNQNLGELEKMIEEIPFLDDIEHRSPYEKKFNAIRKHFHKTHSFIPPYHFSSQWTIAGILIGTLLAVFIFYYKVGTFTIDSALAGATIGLIVGYLIGSAKELSYRKNGKIL